MERKIGETFWFKGKKYKVIAAKLNLCPSCAFKGWCVDSAKVAGACACRSDKKMVIFKEIKDRKIKDNQLTINIPNGMEIDVDVENCDLKAGVIKFKKKDITYKDVCDKFNLLGRHIVVTPNNIQKLIAIDKLLDTARYYNGDWKPDWNNKDRAKYSIIYDNYKNDYRTSKTYCINDGLIYFNNEQDAQNVIDNPNFREILDAIYKD